MSKCKDIIEQFELYEMANASKEETGLPVVAWFSCKTGKEKHGPRFKVRDGYQNKYSYDSLVTVTIDKENPKFISMPKNVKAKDQNSILDWCKSNYDALMDLWNNKITHVQFINKIKK